MAMSNAERVQKRRDTLRAQGLRPVQIWVPDTRAPGFDDEARRQVKVAAAVEAQDVGLHEFLEELSGEVLNDLPSYE